MEKEFNIDMNKRMGKTTIHKKIKKQLEMEKEFNLSCPICKGDSDNCSCRDDRDEEFNLSEKLFGKGLTQKATSHDIKEFIKLLKKRLPSEISIGVIENGVLMQHELIDKLAGDKLNGI